MEKRNNYIFHPLVNLVFFDCLLVATPFLMLQNYLQDSVRSFSKLTFNFSFIEIPIVLFLAAILVLFIIISTYKKITFFKAAVIVFILLLMIIGQKTADYYINYKFYDLQNNWHYLAYGLFAFVMYRFLITKNVTDSQIILATFIKAFLISSFDEGIQVFISNRIFDISDIAKDMWGVVMGLIILFFVVKNGEIIWHGWNIRHKKIKDYINSTIAILFFELVFAYIFLYYSSILTEDRYWYVIFLWSIPVFLIAFLIIHYSSFRFIRLAYILVFIIFILLQGYFFIKNFDENITKCEDGIILYKGIPLVYFDYMIYPDGTFRPVDKKELFKGGDFRKLFEQKADIILIGKGFDNSGGIGFIGTQYVEFPFFVYNFVIKRPSQVVILDTPTACREFNRLKKEKKSVLFVIHNS